MRIKMMRCGTMCAVILFVWCSLANASSQLADEVVPEHAGQIAYKAEVEAKNFIVAAANPYAVQVGFDVLNKGGSAIDAMVAVQAVLGLVEPQSSGLGGGAFLVYYDAVTGRLVSWDGRETAPFSATPELFQNERGEPLKFFDAVVGGRSVGTPGTVKLMADAHKSMGVLNWAELLTPAIELAEKGFEVSPRLANAIANDSQHLARYPATKAYFFRADGEPLQEGDRLINAAYRDTLKLLAKQGETAFYQGGIAKDIVQAVTSANDNPGVLSLQDLAVYKTKQRKVVCVPYRSYEVCGMGPPSSGALTLGQILGIASRFDLKSMGPDSLEAWQVIGDASRLAFADRGRYMADTDFVPMPRGLLDGDYLTQRAKLIVLGQALVTAEPGEPRWGEPIALADDEAIELPSTSHFVIVDRKGNVVSMTTTIENGFGSRLMSNGFLLNNELTDFSFVSHRDGRPIANRLEPGKRPRSSMAPTIVLKDGKPYLALGSPGGSRIIGYVAKTLIAHIDWGMGIQEAIARPHLVNRFGTYDLEKGTAAEKLQPGLEQLGYKTNIRDLNSGLHGVLIGHGHLVGGADPRREGIVLGE